MNLFAPKTGDEKMDKAYQNLQVHITKCKSFDEFFQHFNYIVKTDNKEVLNTWLLKVLYVQMKQKHPFDVLRDSVDDKKKKEIETWLNESIKKYKK